MKFLSAVILALGLSSRPELLRGQNPPPPLPITFEDQARAGDRGAGGGVTITRQYSTLGILFNGPKAFDYSAGPSPLAGFPHSGTRAIEQCYAEEFCTTAFILTFRQPQRWVEVWAGHQSHLGGGTASIRAYTRAGVLVGHQDIRIVPSNIPRIGTRLLVGSDSANIDLVHVMSPDLPTNGFAIDDINFSTGAPPGTRPVVDTLRIPRVIGLPQLAAGDTLTRYKLAMAVSFIDTTGVTDRTVLSQSPDAGSPARGVSVVRVAIARSPPPPPADTLRIPIVVGLSRTDAEDSLARQGMSLTIAGYRVTEDVLVNTVVVQAPEGGTPRRTERVVRVTLARRPSGASFSAVVPSLAGMTIGQALDALAVLKLRLQILGSIEAQGLPGTVFGQEPAPGTLVSNPVAVRVQLVAAQNPQPPGGVPPWIWVLAGAAALLAAYLKFKPDQPVPISTGVSASIVTTGVKNLAVELDGPPTPVAEFSYAVESVRTDQVMVGVPPSIVNEVRLE